MKVTIHTDGPMFNGLAHHLVAVYLEHLKEKVAQEGDNRVHNRLHEVLQHPTGYYESHIHTDRQVNDLVVTDTPVVYGPWLEGVGSRNATTRFKGYFTFRTVAQQLNRDVPAIAEEELVTGGFLRGMNGI